MRAFHLTGAAILVAAVTSCSYPTHSTTTPDNRPSLGFANVSPSAVLVLDDVEMGPAAGFDGDKSVLRVNRGMHKVEIRDGGRILYSERIYLGDEIKRIIEISQQ